VDVSASPGRLPDVEAVQLTVLPRGSSEPGTTETELNVGRGGFGLAVPIAAVIVEGHGGRVRELRSGDRNAGIVVTLPIV
jgi:hypothetical protein